MAEHAEVVAAAARVGLTPTGFCAVAVLAVARGETGPATPDNAEYETLCALQAELFGARSAVNRVGTNLNQAVTVLNATGEAPGWLGTVAGMCARTIAGLDEVISAVHRRLG